MQTALLILFFVVFLAMVVMGQKFVQWIFQRFFVEKKDSIPTDIGKGFSD